MNINDYYPTINHTELGELYDKEKVLTIIFETNIEKDKEIVDLKRDILSSLKIEGEQLQEIERLKGLLKDEFTYFNRDVMFEQREKLWQKFKTENNL